MDFKPGTFYKAKKIDFPILRGSNSFYRESSEPESFPEDSIIFILMPVYIVRTRIIKSQRCSYWCVKVLINDKTGYIHMWEDEWEEIT